MAFGPILEATTARTEDRQATVVGVGEPKSARRESNFRQKKAQMAEIAEQWHPALAPRVGHLSF